VTHECYIDARGEMWVLRCICPPIPSRNHDWEIVHDDYDGAPDAHDHRHFDGPTREDVIRQAAEWVAEEVERG